jgi:hypothetical protein
VVGSEPEFGQEEDRRHLHEAGEPSGHEVAEQQGVHGVADLNPSKHLHDSGGQQNKEHQIGSAGHEGHLVSI